VEDWRGHWERIYREKSDTEVSWYQSSPEVSLSLIEACCVTPRAAIIDVGGGTSGLVDALLAQGHSDLTVLDISQEALKRTRQRLGSTGDDIRWLQQDVTHFRPARTWDVWHDRAVFHFLVDPDRRMGYREALREAVKPGGQVIIATFAMTGPERCSGQYVMRYDHETMQEELGTGYELLETKPEQHETPSGSVQDFTYCRFRVA
jgi:trans-aconitate methyltransferase